MDYMTSKEVAKKWGGHLVKELLLCRRAYSDAVKMTSVLLIPKLQRSRLMVVGGNTMKIAICDDDLVLNKKLHQFIFETYHDINLRIDEYRSGEEFLQKISASKLTYDLLLLYIEIDKVNGITVAKELKQLSPKTFVVFITSHDEFTTVGYEVSAFRYLMKPINKSKLIETIEAAKEEILSTKSISFQNKDGGYIIPLNDILYFEAQNQEVLASTMEQQLLHRGNLNDYEQRLSQEGFYRVHRSCLVNLRFAKADSKTKIILNGEQAIPLIRLRYRDFTTCFQEYIKRTAR